MIGLGQERILLVADRERELAPTLAAALPQARITAVATVFDAVAELVGNSYTTVLAAAAPIERRPEAAVRTLREIAGDGRLVLFGHPTLEPLSRKMMEFGCDDYIVTPVKAQELQQLVGSPSLRLTPASTQSANGNGQLHLAPSGRISALMGLPIASILLDAFQHHPHDAVSAALRTINARLAPTMVLHRVVDGQNPPPVPKGAVAVEHPFATGSGKAGALILHMPQEEDETTARHILAELANVGGKLGVLVERHNSLVRLATTDDLTGLYNGRYFRQFLTKICKTARAQQFKVTLLLFDIDDFKKYNDDFGHTVGDQILQQTARVMRSCCRDHDHVARIGGDEFAVVFWDKEGPRQPREHAAPPAPRPPQTPTQIFKRFQKIMASPEYQLLGDTGKGTLTISGGMASFPWEANTPEELIEMADRKLMFGAKRSGKDTLFLVGGQDAESGMI